MIRLRLGSFLSVAVALEAARRILAFLAASGSAEMLVPGACPNASRQLPVFVPPSSAGGWLFWGLSLAHFNYGPLNSACLFSASGAEKGIN
jgi:hypothetical protein